uniref:Uncharacterized protein n=1 Tax=viral metagenome TaxID=1070528 RepID=A0A6M3LW99_9ZZZZ
MNQARINEKQNIEIREGATTIPKGSTLQANGSGSARHLMGDDDIVCSAWRYAAALKGGLDLANQDEQLDDQTALNETIAPMYSDVYSKSCEFMGTPFEYAKAA